MTDPDDGGTPPADGLTPSERRIGYRYLSCFPAYVVREGDGARAAMIHDLSVSGTLLLVRTVLKVGETVRLRLFFTGDETREPCEVIGEVVRSETLEDPFAGPWSHRVAVQFDAPLVGVDAEIAALAKRQAAAR